MSQPLEIISTKVSNREKQQIDKGAALNEMSRSEFMRAILFKKIEKLEQFSQLPPSVIVDNDKAEDIAQLLQQLQRKYPDATGSEIIKSALMLTIESEKQLLSFKLKKFL